MAWNNLGEMMKSNEVNLDLIALAISMFVQAHTQVRYQKSL